MCDLRRSLRNVSLLLVLLMTVQIAYDSALAANAQNGPAIGAITTNLDDYPNGQVPQYDKFEVTFAVSDVPPDLNEFDPNEMRVDGYIVSPSKDTLVHPAFYYQDYDVSTVGESEVYTAIGDPVWKLRFTPEETGTYTYSIQITGTVGTITSAESTFEVVGSDNPGFIHVSVDNPRYFAFGNGDPFVGVGLNVAWWQFEDRRISTYDYYLNRMDEYGANLARVWMTNSGRDQDWILSIQDKELGGDYNLEEAWALDRILDTARQNAVCFLLTLDDVNQYTYNWPTQNLYNSALGGPCGYRSAIFTNADAQRYQQRILRYIIARWGYSPSILSWELFNEINELEWSDPEHWDRQDMVDWHQRMAQYVKSTDAHGHLTNTSTGSFKTHEDLYEALPEMELAQIHFYYVPGWPWHPSDPEGRDMAALTRYYSNLVHSSVSGEPAIVGEWGVLNDQWTASPYLESDGEGVHLHNGLWSSLMSGAAATGLNWHWGYHKTHDAGWWSHYRAIANYFADIEIDNLAVAKPVNAHHLLLFGIPWSAQAGEELDNLILPQELEQAFGDQGISLFDGFTVTPIVSGSEWDLEVLVAAGGGQLRVKTYSLLRQGEALNVYVDLSPPVGSSDFSSANTKLRAMGLRRGSLSVYAWIQNTENTWWNYVHGSVPDPQSGIITVGGLAPQRDYEVEYWDSYTGHITGTHTVVSDLSGSIPITVADLVKDVAVKVRILGPLISGLPDVSADEDASLDNAIDLWTYTSDAQTPDSSLTFTIDNSPNPGAGVTIDSNRYIDIRPVADWYGSTSVRIEVADPEGAFDTDTFQVIVKSVNDPPWVEPEVPSQTADEDVPITIDLTSYEHDVESIGAALKWTVSGQDRCTVSGEGSDNDVLTFTPEPDFHHSDVVTLTLTDAQAASAQQALTLTWHPVNPSSVAISGPTKGGVEVSLAFSATTSPITATQPITYVWLATEHSPVTHTRGLSDTVTLMWNAEGREALTVTAANAGGTAVDSHDITIGNWTLQGTVYEGAVGEEPPNSQPVQGVTITVWGSYNAYPDSGEPIRSTTTDGYGWYGLPVYDDDGAWEFYHIIETVPPDYTAIGARSVSGTVRRDHWIEYEAPLEGKTLTGNKFWLRAIPRYGWLEGQVTDSELGAPAAPCTGASVHVEPGGLDIPADPVTGYYGPMELAGGTYSVQASAPGFSGSGPYNVDVVAGVTTTQDFPLQRPAAEVTPAELGVTATISESVSRVLTVKNNGHVPLDFEIQESLPPADLPWVAEDIISGTVPGLGEVGVDVTFHCTETGEFVGALSIVHNDPCEDAIEVPIALHCPESPQLEWAKWLNGEPWVPDIVVSAETSDTIQVVDAVAGSQSFSLIERWDLEYLQLLDYQVEPAVGTVITGPGTLEWQVPPDEPAVVTMTKWFHVQPCNWETTSCAEELWVEEELVESRSFLVEKALPDLWIDSAYDSEVSPGQAVAFLLRYGNQGGYEPGVVVWSEFPPQAPLVSANPPPDSAAIDGSWAEWHVGDLARDGEGDVEVVVAIAESAVPSTTIALGGAVWDHTGQTADTAEVAFHVAETCPPPSPDFVWDPATICPGTTVYFWDTSANSPTGWLWDFGGLGSSALQNPDFAFGATGTFDVRLTVSNTCGSDVVTRTLQVTECQPQGDDYDIYIRDNDTDDGAVPSSSPWWTSPDIWVRHADDGDTHHQNPLPGTTNTVYVRVRNRMATTAHDITVNLYSANPALQFQWPQSWSPIGSFNVASLAAGAETVTPVPWTTPSIVGHFCLLARGDSPDDLIGSGPDTVAPTDRAPNNNNIGLRNVNIVDYPEISECGVYTTTVYTDVVYLDVVNAWDTSTAVDVALNGAGFPFETGTIALEPGGLWGRWSSLEHFNQVGSALSPTALPATIGDILMSPFETVRVTMTIAAEMDERFALGIQERVDGAVVGGIDYVRDVPVCVYMPIMLKTYSP